MATTKESFVFYKDWWNAISSLPEQIRGEVCENIIRYACGETVASMSEMAAMAMRFITPQIDRDRVKYEARCKKNRANGSLGGRPSPAAAAKPNGYSEIRTQPNASTEIRTVTDVSAEYRTGCDNVNETVNVNENKNENENENVCANVHADENVNKNENQNQNENACECANVNDNADNSAPAPAHAPAHTDEEKEIFSKFQSWLTVYAPTVLLFKEPLRIEQFLWLYRTYGADRLKQCSADVHNKEAYLRNRNAFNTFKLWIKSVKI